MTEEHRAPFLRMRSRSRFRAHGGVAALAAPHGRAATFIVSSTSASGAGSLQQAISNANVTHGTDTIIFQIPGCGVHTITPTTSSPLPSISNAVVIDGTTQAGFTGTPSSNSMAPVPAAPPTACSDGGKQHDSRPGDQPLWRRRHSRPVPGGTNFIQGNFIGTDPTGTLSQGNGDGAVGGCVD